MTAKIIYSKQLIELATDHAEKTRCNAIELASQFGFSESKAKIICLEVSRKIAAIEDAEVRAVEHARLFASQNVVSWRKLMEKFGISIHHARKITEEAAARRKKRKEVSAIKQEKCRKYCELHWQTVNVTTLAKRFSVSTNTARKVLDEVREIMQPKKVVVKRHGRKVRVFAEISHSDLTVDRVRYPSGIGFAVLEVVR